jgi:hypothetical protein
MKRPNSKPQMVNGVMVTDTAIYSAQKDGTVLILDAELPECKLCHTARAMFVNRHGKTRCVDCDAKYQKIGANIQVVPVNAVSAGKPAVMYGITKDRVRVQVDGKWRWPEGEAQHLAERLRREVQANLEGWRRLGKSL